MNDPLYDFGSKMIIYISGPITSNPNFDADFANAEQFLVNLYSPKISLTIINPVRLSKAVIGDPLTYDQYLYIDTMLISLCTHIFMLKNWDLSYGCKVEYFTALKHNLTILFQ